MLVVVWLAAQTGLCGCASVRSHLRDVVGQTPTASVVGVRVVDLDLRSVTLGFDVDVGNPYGFELPLVDFDVALSTNGQGFLDGGTQVDGAVPARGHKTIALPVRVDLVGLVNTVRSVRPGQVIPYDAELGLWVDPGVSAPIRLPLHKSGRLPVPKMPSIDVRSFQWDRISLSRVRGNLVLGVGNSNEFPFSLSSMKYDLDLAKVRVAEGETTPDLELPAGDTAALTIPLSFSPASVGTALLSVLGGGELDYGIGGSITLETPFGSMRLPYDRSGRADSRSVGGADQR
jgi:LEA14-like dessication related protein